MTGVLAPVSIMTFPSQLEGLGHGPLERLRGPTIPILGICESPERVEEKIGATQILQLPVPDRTRRSPHLPRCKEDPELRSWFDMGSQILGCHVAEESTSRHSDAENHCAASHGMARFAKSRQEVLRTCWRACWGPRNPNPVNVTIESFSFSHPSISLHMDGIYTPEAALGWLQEGGHGSAS